MICQVQATPLASCQLQVRGVKNLLHLIFSHFHCASNARWLDTNVAVCERNSRGSKQREKCKNETVPWPEFYRMHACVFHLLRNKTGHTGSDPTSPPSVSLLIGPSVFGDAVGGNVSNSVAVQDGLRGSDERLAKCSGSGPLCVTSCVSEPRLQQPVSAFFFSSLGGQRHPRQIRASQARKHSQTEELRTRTDHFPLTSFTADARPGAEPECSGDGRCSAAPK